VGASFDVVEVVYQVELARPLVFVHFFEGVLESDGSVDYGSNCRDVISHVFLQFGGVRLLFGEIGDVKVEGAIFRLVDFSHGLKDDFFRPPHAFVETANQRRRRRFIVRSHVFSFVFVFYSFLYIFFCFCFFVFNSSIYFLFFFLFDHSF